MADASEPQRAEQREPPWQRTFRFGPGQREDEERADGQRRDELGERRKLQTVIEEADDEHPDCGEEDRQPGCREVEELQRCEDDGETGDRARRDRRPAHRRRRRGVPAVVPRRHQGADCRRHAPNDDAPGNGGERRQDDGEQGECFFGCHVRVRRVPASASACRATRTACCPGCRCRLYPVLRIRRAAVAAADRASGGRWDSRPLAR